MQVKRCLLIAAVICILSFSSCETNQCEKCQDGSSCCGDEICCGVGDFCCPSSSLCCNDTCCDKVTQTCCPDPKNGAVCCEKETTYCCPPNFGRPSRCCPRWMVCCPEGQEGCCLNPSYKGDELKEVLRKFAKKTAHGLFELSNFDGTTPMAGVELDLSSGDRVEHLVSGPFNNWGEMTRIFAYDPIRDLFYLLQANFTSSETKVQKRDPKQPITLYTINPLTGVGTSKIVQGAVDQVTGYVFDRHTGNLVMATYSWQNDSITGYLFYSVDPTTAVATHLSTFQNSNGEDSFAGWNFQDISPDGKTIYRLGHKNPTIGDQFGLSLIDISQKTATMQFISNFTVPSGYDPYISFDLYGRGEFLSLAPANGILNQGELSLIKWDLQGGTKITPLGNANLPEYFGSVDPFLTTDQTTYVAAVVYNDYLNSDFNRWAVAVVDLTGTTAPSLLVFWPWMLSGTDSVSGFGIPDKQ